MANPYPSVAQPQDQDARLAWDIARAMQQRACELVHTHTNDGVRLSGLKLVESIVLLLTAECAPALPGVVVLLLLCCCLLLLLQLRACQGHDSGWVAEPSCCSPMLHASNTGVYALVCYTDNVCGTMAAPKLPQAAALSQEAASQLCIFPKIACV